MKKFLSILGLVAIMAAPARSSPVHDSPPGQKAEQYNDLNLDKKTAPTVSDQLTVTSIVTDHAATPIRLMSAPRADASFGPPIGPMERSAQVTRYRLNKMRDRVINKVNMWMWASRTNMVRRLRQ